MLPTIGQGARRSVEDEVALATAFAGRGGPGQALRRYEHARVRRVRLMTALSRVSALARRPGPAGRVLSAAGTARLLAPAGEPVSRRVATLDARMAREAAEDAGRAAGHQQLHPARRSGAGDPGPDAARLPPAAPLLVLASCAAMFGYLAQRFFRMEWLNECKENPGAGACMGYAAEAG
jgi:hypothetical protein